VKDDNGSDSCGFFYLLPELSVAAVRHRIPLSIKFYFFKAGAAQWGRKANF
jgi:hypothetical protein